jgi:hypothetical protein
VPLPGSPEGNVVIDRAGRAVNVSELIWKTNDPTQHLSMDWRDVSIPSEKVLAATRAYFKYLIRNYSVGEIKNNWSALYRVWESPSFQAVCAMGEDIPYSTISEVQAALEAHERYRLHFVRKWYNWCCDQGFENFSPEVAFQLNELVIGGNCKGEAVQSANPEEGPLVDTEIVALNNALRAARVTNVLSLKEQVALWLCIALGSNSGPLALLREDDIEKLATADAEGTLYQIRVPRHKKGDAVERMQFRTRKLTAEIGEIIELLIAENQAFSDRADTTDGRPLLRRSMGRKDIEEEGPLWGYRYHYSSPDLIRFPAECFDHNRPKSA